MVSDAQLVDQSKDGQLSAYDELVRRWSARVCAYISARIRRQHIVEELSQETFLRAYRSLASLTDTEKFGSWMLAIAHRLVLDWCKAKSRTEVSMSTLVDEGFNPADTNGKAGSPSASLEQSEQRLVLKRHIDELPEELREVLLIFYFDELGYREIARMLDVAVPTIGARLSRARELLRSRINAESN